MPINKESLKVDSSNMFEILKNFPKQIREAIALGDNAPQFKNNLVPSNRFAILGMGGSAIGGDIVRCVASQTKGAEKLQITTHRQYYLPEYIDSTVNIIASSYSGNTEETLSAFECARARTQKIISIASGGEIIKRSKEDAFPYLMLPEGLQPRCAVGYSFFSLLGVFEKNANLSDETLNDLKAAKEETISLMENKSEVYSNLDSKLNPAIALAEKLHNTIPIFYSSEKLEAVNLRWRGQIQENAKNFAFGNILPEMCHNEIMQWSAPEIAKNCSIIFLIEKADHERVSLRIEALKSILGDKVKQIIELKSEAESYMARAFDLIYLADWTSYYLALLNGFNPTPVENISQLKSRLALAKSVASK